MRMGTATKQSSEREKISILKTIQETVQGDQIRFQ